MSEIRADNDIQFAWSGAFASADASLASRAAKYAAAAATTISFSGSPVPAPARAPDQSSYDIYVAALGSWPALLVFSWYGALGLMIELHNGMPCTNWLLHDTLYLLPRVDWYGPGWSGPNWNAIGRAFGALLSVLVSVLATLVSLAAKLLFSALFALWSSVRDGTGVAGDVVIFFAREIRSDILDIPTIDLVRLRLRLARNWLYRNSAGAVLVVSALALFAMCTAEKAPSTSAPALEIREYHIPEYLILAQPQNRPRDGSSSHYILASEPISWALVGDNDVPINTLLATKVETARHTESTTAQLLATAGSATASVPARKQVEGIAYCQQCRQRHCCEVPY